MFKEHNCNVQPSGEEIKIIYGPSIDTRWEGWIMQISSIADEKEVQMGEAEYVGEVTYQSQFYISYCPFCGVELN